MELEEALQKRRSVRSFTNEPVSDEAVEKILHAAMSGPSAVNMRPWEFYIVKDPSKRADLNRVGYAKYPSPLMIVLAGNSHHFLPLEAAPYWTEDVSAAAENILLECTNLGLGAVWCGVYPIKSEQKQVSQTLDLPSYIEPFGIIIIGHPDGPIPEPRDQYDEKKIHRI
jgi:nitroreductase